MARRSISLDELRARIGTEIGLSDWLLVDQELINRFADATFDHYFLHTDPVRAAETQMGGTIAHGFLTLALLAPMSVSGLPAVKGVAMGVNYGFDRLRFIAPVPSGKRIRARFVLKGLVEKAPGQWQITHGVTVEVEGQDTPALAAEWVNRYWIEDEALRAS
jgi:acyl dehydratase